MPSLLAVDDDPQVLECLRLAFQDTGVTLKTACTAVAGLEEFARSRPEVVLLDVDLPDLSGVEIFRRIRQLDAKVLAIFLTGSNSTDTAIEAMSLGAFEYLLKPFRLPELMEAVQRALEVSRLMRTPAVVPEMSGFDPTTDVMVGRCPAMQAVYKSIGRAAPQDVTVLILGESGTGKELVARAIYQHSKRSTGRFLAINCVAIPETLLESELFGHEKGAFTGANQKKIGKFEQCSAGTLFLDEVGDMTPLTQTKVLRVLQEQKFERVGGNETVHANVRIIAATNRDLENLVAGGLFRGDLYYRLNVYAIRLPPLRDRLDDLPLLVEYFLRRFSQELGKDVQSVAGQTLQALRRHSWPGNLRELQSTLKHALLQSSGPTLLPEFLPEPLRTLSQQPDSIVPEPQETAASAWDLFIDARLNAGTNNLYAEWQTLTDERLLARVLPQVNGNLTHAAKILGMHRSTLRIKMEASGLMSPQKVSP